VANPLFKLEINPTFRDIEGRFTKADNQLLSDRREQVKDLARQHVLYAQDEAPKRTGDFAKGIRFRSFVSGLDSIGYTLSDPQPLGKWIRLGTKPHTIEPKGAGYPLAFYWAKIGGMMFTYRVNHPGTKPNDYMARANDRIEPEMDRTTARISTRYVKTIAHGRSI
jgi:hypothetical protein